ncbi:ribonuclease P protein component 1 [Halostagnicola kamekurae]|uniref:Ribonuclease P protein component 1 n=1 Tax=Halostagnicola kamekurae TaxID=619731 RepID=A0A1I6QGD6_9EURY|nr:ribonuclease P protein component 1 [Halostagnicola kamekurae]SFS51527.1 ribonuclease P protein subunit POP4 [Halostagnicola kamekurae]
MALTPETLPRHELNGLPVRVVESDDEGQEGLEGRVVVETMKTLSIEVCVPPEAERWRDCSTVDREDGTSRVVMVPKSGTVFEFAITDEAAGDEKSSGTASKLADTQPSSSGEDRAGAPTDGCRADWHAAGEDVAYVTVDGSRLLSRPARRTETSGDSPWQ